jgi:hypothetical protein
MPTPRARIARHQGRHPYPVVAVNSAHGFIPPNPVVMPEYKLKLADKATSQNEQASAMFDKGTRARYRGDAYVRITVYLATAGAVISIRNFGDSPNISNRNR